MNIHDNLCSKQSAKRNNTNITRLIGYRLYINYFRITFTPKC